MLIVGNALNSVTTADSGRLTGNKFADSANASANASETAKASNARPTVTPTLA